MKDRPTTDKIIELLLDLDQIKDKHPSLPPDAIRHIISQLEGLYNFLKNQRN
jgi:hypothetical protein